MYHFTYCFKVSEPDPPVIDITFDDVVAYQYTGETTVVSKGAVLTHRMGCMVQMYKKWFNAKRGESIKAFVVLKEGGSATPEELLEFCKTRLAKYKWPAEIEIRKSMPESNVGKILKKELRTEMAKKK